MHVDVYVDVCAEGEVIIGIKFLNVLVCLCHVPDKHISMRCCSAGLTFKLVS